MFPLYDQWQIGGKKIVVLKWLIGLNVLIFLFSLIDLNFYINKYGLIPKRIYNGKSLYTIFTSMFFHAEFSHIAGNMWFLWVFGKNMEKRLGRLKFLLFYFLCGIVSAVIYLMLSPNKVLPAIGASGAISGILGGYIVLFPKNKIISIVPIFFFIEIIPVSVLFFVGIWFLYQLLYIGSQTMVAYWAHIGGFAAGVLFIKLFAGKYQYISYDKV